MYVPSNRKVMLLYDVVFDESFSSALIYTSRPYLEVMAMRPAVTYPFATSSKEQTGNVITFTHFEEGNLITDIFNDTESGEEYNSESLMMNGQDMENLDEK